MGLSRDIPTGGRRCCSCGAAVPATRCGTCGTASRVGQYAVDRVLTQNARGRVYVATGPSGERVVLKELVFRTVSGVQQIEAFEREAAVLKKLDHPRIPRFICTIHDGDGVHLRLYLVQQFIEGRSFLEELADGPLPEGELRSIAEQCLEVLRYLQGPGLSLLHRDIKPANLIRDPAGRLWLVDFGTARALHTKDTHRATLVGTFGYAPPEQLGGTVDVTTDLYGLGASLIHLASGVAPETMLTPDLALDFERHVRVSRPFRAFLRGLVARKRADRPQSADEALALLHAPASFPWPRFRNLPWRRTVLPAPLGLILLGAPLPLAFLIASLLIRHRDAAVSAERPQPVRAAPALHTSPPPPGVRAPDLDVREPDLDASACLQAISQIIRETKSTDPPISFASVTGDLGNPDLPDPAQSAPGNHSEFGADGGGFYRVEAGFLFTPPDAGPETRLTIAFATAQAPAYANAPTVDPLVQGRTYSFHDHEQGPSFFLGEAAGSAGCPWGYTPTGENMSGVFKAVQVTPTPNSIQQLIVIAFEATCVSSVNPAQNGKSFAGCVALR